jgi:catechol 2,3-dioxygenase-like lactoylglutathione lyase family enzyme
VAKIKHITIAAKKPSETAKFYRDVFDLEPVGEIEGENAEGYYLSDGDINLAILRFKNETVAGELGIQHEGLHHIGFQVDNLEAADAKLRKASSLPMEEINDALRRGTGNGGRNVELKYGGPDGVMIDVSQHGWVGTDGG